MISTNRPTALRVPARRHFLAAASGLALGSAMGRPQAQPTGRDLLAPRDGRFEVYDDFADTSWPSARWLKFRTSEYDLWDPAAEVAIGGKRPGALTIDLPRFTTSHPNHVKAMLLSTRSFDVQQVDGFNVRVDMQVRTFGTERNPHGLEAGDVRLAAGAMVVIDPDTGMVFDFFVSNDRIRPLYERLPSARAQLGDYPAYSILGATMATAPGAWHRYEIRYMPATNRVEWWVDDQLLASQERVGAAPGEDGPVVKLRRPRIGGGLFTLLDALNDDRRQANDHPKTPGFVPSNWEDRFGQGAQLAFRKFEVGVTR